MCKWIELIGSDYFFNQGSEIPRSLNLRKKLDIFLYNVIIFTI